MKMVLKLKRRGDISTVFATMIAILLIAVSFSMYMTLNIDTMKYQNMSQYARDALLVLETNGKIERSYLSTIKSDLSSKLNMKAGESLNIYVTIGAGAKKEVNSMPITTVADYGENINIEFVYTYKKKSYSKSNSIIPTVTKTNETMTVDLSTISKNRRVSDG